MGRPIVGTRVGGLPEVVLHQKTGLLVDKGDSHGLAQAISHLLEHPEDTVQMGQEARRMVKKTFGLDRCIDAYEALHQNLCGNHG